MNLFKSFNLKYDDIIQLDGAVAGTHKLYNEPTLFHGINGEIIVDNTQIGNNLSGNQTGDAFENIFSSSTTNKNVTKNEYIKLWKEYWFEYIFAFDKMIEVLPSSIVTAFIGRQAIEIGLKYLLISKNGCISKDQMTHNIGELSETVFQEYNINEDYMDWVVDYCKGYSNDIEDGVVEYFRYPEYKNSNYYAGDFLDIHWLSYNAALVLVKLIHFSGIEV